MLNLVILPYMYLSFSNPSPAISVNEMPEAAIYQVKKPNLLSEKTISLEKRYPEEWVNGIFKDNILLTLSYLSGEYSKKADINWVKVEEPKTIAFVLNSGETFAFHDQILEDYKKSTVKTTNAHFNYEDGFKSDGRLMGDGVCHLASLMYWVSKDAGLNVLAPTDHNFAEINQIPKEYGVSIFNLPGSYETSARQNLYITNNYINTVTFVFYYDGHDLTLKITKPEI